MPNSFCTPAPMNTIPVTNRRTAGPNLSFRQTCSSPAFSTNWGHLRKQITKLSYKSGADSAHVEANEFGEIAVALVFHLLLDADLRRVVCLHDARLQPGEEDLFRLLRLSLVLCHPGQNRKPLVRGRLHERLAGGLEGQLLDRSQAFPPIRPLVLFPGFRQPGIDKRGDVRRASARRVIVGRNDQLAQLVDQRELARREKRAPSGGRSCGGGRLGVQGLADANRSANGCRRSKLDQFAPAQVEIRVAGHHRFPFMSSVVRYSDDRHASAMIVHVGFWHEALTWLLPSTTNRFFTS